jgi:hypothetical protein
MNRTGDGVNLYVVTFNSPPQLQILLDTIQESNPELLNKTTKYLINNSAWLNEPEADSEVPNVFGGSNSVIFL